MTTDIVLVNPTASKAVDAVEKALSTHLLLIIVGKCRVTYEGRARSKLPEGERLLLVKEDGSILIHRKRDYAPVNWQPPGSLFYSEVHGSSLRMRALRRQPPERLDIEFQELRLVAGLLLKDEAEFILHADEAEMRKAIILRPSLIQGGFRPTDSEKPLNSGFVDLYGSDLSGNKVVIEFKKDTADKKAVLQLSRYVNELRTQIPHRTFRGVLAAPSLRRDATRLLKTLGFEFVRLDPKYCAEIISQAPPPESLTHYLTQEGLKGQES